MTTAIDCRRPTCRPSWPLILIEGGEKSGKSWATAELTASGQFSECYMIAWGEKNPDSYGAVPGADYWIVNHDGTFASVANQVWRVHKRAQEVNDEGGKPVFLVIDSMTTEWDTLKAIANGMATKTPEAEKLLADHPGREVTIPMNVWNAVNDKHDKLMELLATFPGVCVMTARGKRVAAIDDNGKPIPNTKSYTVEGQKNIAYRADAWVRLEHGQDPRVVGCASPNWQVRPASNGVAVPGFTLEKLIFNVLLRDPDGKPAWWVEQNNSVADAQDMHHSDATPDREGIDATTAAIDEITAPTEVASTGSGDDERQADEHAADNATTIADRWRESVAEAENSGDPDQLRKLREDLKGAPELDELVRVRLYNRVDKQLSDA